MSSQWRTLVDCYMHVVQQPQKLGFQTPSDERRVAGTTRADDDADRSRRRNVTSVTWRFNDVFCWRRHPSPLSFHFRHSIPSLPIMSTNIGLTEKCLPLPLLDASLAYSRTLAYSFRSLTHNQWGVNLAQRQRSSTFQLSGDQTQFAVADSMSLSECCPVSMRALMSVRWRFQWR